MARGLCGAAWEFERNARKQEWSPKGQAQEGASSPSGECRACQLPFG